MTSAQREALILSLKPTVLDIALRRWRTLPRMVELDELISAGWLGAIDAVDRFDPARHVRLSSYAKFRISGAIEDYLRSLDPLTRDDRKLVKRQKAAEVVTISATPCYIGDTLHDPLFFVADTRAARNQRALDARLTLQAIYGRARLKPRNAKVLKMYMQGDTMKAVGRAFSIKESRISQVCREALQKLRAAA